MPNARSGHEDPLWDDRVGLDLDEQRRVDQPAYLHHRRGRTDIAEHLPVRPADLYTHVIPIVAREAADRIAALIGEPMEARPTDVEKPLSSANLARDPDSDGETNP